MAMRTRLARLERGGGPCRGLGPVLVYSEGEPKPEVPVCRRCGTSHAIVICEVLVRSQEEAAATAGRHAGGDGTRGGDKRA